MSGTVPAIIASLGVTLILSALAIHGLAYAIDSVTTLVQPQGHGQRVQLVDKDQANLMIIGGVGLLVLAAWVHIKK